MKKIEEKLLEYEIKEESKWIVRFLKPVCMKGINKWKIYERKKVNKNYY